jgi:hypothetical protein
MSMKTIWTVMLLLCGFISPCLGCAAVTIARGHVVNADQSVIMIWDRERKMQHFIRQANFKTDAPDVGFVVPSPSRPELEEAGNGAFASLKEITAPYVLKHSFSIGCSAGSGVPVRESSVRVVEEKRVAGYDATVLTARSGKDLVEWLEQNGYPYSPAMAEWAGPYIGGDWHFTVLKVAKGKLAKEIKTSALRISFRTERPLFPYREPASAVAKEKLDVSSRLLRIYFIADARYRGQIDGRRPWSGKVVWANDITRHRERLLRELKLPESTGPQKWWLTEFEDHWPYEKAAGDVYFSRDPEQGALDTRSRFSPQGYDASFLGAFVVLCVNRLRRRR